ncbi:uncharacterized protein LOC116416121 [Nasonia vitripennis]|uniref:Uncharacterized protein n=1 Tax=Nasonia vitripennis TaxID=7425 RepID=A0A7M7Q1L5_NASVI|nr:uncharacterized protein LOC116416121 [Nasonia vitripennis]
MISEASFSADDEIFEVPNDPRYTVKFLKQSETNVANAIWSRPLDHRGKYYGHKLNPAESKGPATFPYTNNTSSTSNNRSNLRQSKAPSNVLEQQYETLRRYGYQNNMRVVSESHSWGLFNPIQLSNRRPQDEMPHFEQPLNHLDKITLLNKAELNRKRGSGFGSFFDGSPIRTTRNHYSATKHLMRSLASPPPILRQNVPVVVSGGLQVIPAPNLQRGSVSGDNLKDTKSSRNSTGEEVMHNIMSMTASQIWKNVSEKATETKEKRMATSKSKGVLVIERRIDDEPTVEEETKEEQVPTESMPFTSSTATPIMANKTDKVEAKIKEAVREMMGLFSLW